jgi:hypothetical protein
MLSTKASPDTNEPTLETSASFEALETGLVTESGSQIPPIASSQPMKLQPIGPTRALLGDYRLGV